MSCRHRCHYMRLSWFPPRHFSHATITYPVFTDLFLPTTHRLTKKKHISPTSQLNGYLKDIFPILSHIKWIKSDCERILYAFSPQIVVGIKAIFYIIWNRESFVMPAILCAVYFLKVNQLMEFSFKKRNRKVSHQISHSFWY